MASVIALLTDFGTVDPFVGVMKGVILSRCPEARIVDLTHAIPPQRVQEGAFWLERAAPYFGGGTVFVAVVDPGVGTARRALIAQASGRVFVGPDNGVLAPVLRRDPRAAVYVAEPARLGLGNVSPTFHGRDVFAPIAAELASGRLRPSDAGEAVRTWEDGGVPAPVVQGDAASGEVVTVDRFGNLMTNLDAPTLAQLGDATALVVEIRGRTLPLRRTYADAKIGDYVAVVGAFGVVEVARREGDAARSLGLGRGEPVTIRR